METWNLKIGEELKAETKIYRYMTITQFMSLVEKNKTYLTRTSNWDDPWENPYYHIPTINSDNKVEYSYEHEHSPLFAQCWTLKSESDAMWRIYSPNKDGLKISTTIGKLKLIEGLNEAFIRKVIYFDESKLLDKLKQAKNVREDIFYACLKRSAFSHEEEVRFIIENSPRFLLNKRSKKENYMEFNVDAGELIEEVIIDPRAPDYYVETIELYCKKSKLRAVPKKSKLYNSEIPIYKKYSTKK